MLGPQHVNSGGKNVQFTGDPSSLRAQYRVPECCEPSCGSFCGFTCISAQMLSHV